MAQAYVQAGWTFVAMTYPLMPTLRLTELVDQTAAGLVEVDRQLTERDGKGIDVMAAHLVNNHLHKNCVNQKPLVVSSSLIHLKDTL